MRAAVLVLGGMVGVALRPVAAQDAIPTIAIGSRVQVTYGCDVRALPSDCQWRADCRREVGTVRAVTRDSVLLRPDGAPDDRAYSWNDVVGVRISRGRPLARNVLIGGAAGAAAGALAGSAGSGSGTDGDGRLGRAVGIGAAVGTALGVAAGVLLAGERWDELAFPHPLVTAAGGLGFRLHVRF